MKILNQGLKIHVGFICPIERISQILAFVFPKDRLLLSLNPACYMDLQLVFMTKTIGKWEHFVLISRRNQDKMKIINKVPSAQVKKMKLIILLNTKEKGRLSHSCLFFSQKNPIDGYACTRAHAWVYIIDKSWKWEIGAKSFGQQVSL